VRRSVEAMAGRHGPYPHLRRDDGGAYLTPQILTGVTHDMRVMRDESFGPVVGIMPVSTDEEALR
jgi:acyl-CoA reductase-like NAD-dependent aldehyde dehydrogenase